MKFVVPLLFICFSFNSYSWPFSQEELKEVIVWGFYTRENQEEIKKAEEYLQAMGDLKKGESVEEKFPNLELGKEKYNRSGQRFCYNETQEETKEEDTVFNPNLKVRLYDEKGNVLSEDFLRDKVPENSNENSYEWQVISYIPYHREGHSLQLVRTEGDNEILLERLEFHSLEKLQKEIEEGQFYAYLYDGDCYISPPLM